VSAPDDATLLGWLREAAEEADPMPEFVLEAARGAFALRRLDAELAELVRDSADERAGLIAVRGEGDVRLISFETGLVAVELQVTQRGPVRDLVAQISGANVALAEVETPGRRHGTALAQGVVTADGVPGGLLRLHVHTADGHDLVTSWVRA
jgi:hypothetical protein